MERVIIGITGKMAGGKGTVAAHLVEQGFVPFVLSDVIRAKATEYKWPHTRKVLQNLGDEMRRTGGAAILVEKIAEKEEFKQANLIVIDGIRHPKEIEYLRAFFDATIIAVVASDEKIFELIKSRGREGDPATLEEFREAQKRESDLASSNPDNPNIMNVEACINDADLKIENEGTVGELIRNTDITLMELGIGIKHIHKERE